MASSIIHLCVAKEILKQIPIEEELFLYGNILPDCIKPETKKAKGHFYYKVKELKSVNVDLEKFLHFYENELIGPVEQGVYTHLITDHLWLKNLQENHLINIDGIVYLQTTRGNIRKNKKTIYKDYRKMTYDLVKQYDIDAQFINRIQYDGIFIDIYDESKQKSYEKMNIYLGEIETGEMQIYTKEEIELFIKQAVKESIKGLKKLAKKG